MKKRGVVDEENKENTNVNQKAKLIRSDNSGYLSSLLAFQIIKKRQLKEEDKEELKFLVKNNGFDPDYRDKNSNTFLEVAVIKHKEVIGSLLNDILIRRKALEPLGDDVDYNLIGDDVDNSGYFTVNFLQDTDYLI